MFDENRKLANVIREQQKRIEELTTARRIALEDMQEWKNSGRAWLHRLCAWKDWAAELLEPLGHHIDGEQQCDEAAREIIASLVRGKKP